MTSFTPSTSALKSLKDSVIVLTGGATGIGAATVRLLHSAGANVVFGDINTAAAEALISSLPGPNQPLFVHCNVAKYQDNVKLFKTAFQKFGRIDHAIANAGLGERTGWFEPGMTPEDVESAPSMDVLDVNLTGVLYFSRVACGYLSQGPPRNRSLTLLSSVAGFEESPGLFVYQAAKHGVLGLMRSLRLCSVERFGVRVNCVCPWMTRTGMVRGIEEGWIGAGLPVNEPGDVAGVVGGLVCGAGGKDILVSVEDEGGSGRGLEGACNTSGVNWDGGEGLNGRAIYVEGGRGWDIEEGLAYTQPYWLGKGPAERLLRGQKQLGEGSGWTK